MNIEKFATKQEVKVRFKEARRHNRRKAWRVARSAVEIAKEHNMLKEFFSEAEGEYCSKHLS